MKTLLLFLLPLTLNAQLPQFMEEVRGGSYAAVP
jgi:hypothetical protein